MTGSARQSYYEIALTNRQVLTVFVFLLVSVLAAFLAGVWVGKRAPVGQVETVEAQAIEAATEPESEPLARLDFFSRDAETPTEEAPAAVDERAAVGEPEAVDEPVSVVDSPAAETAGGSEESADAVEPAAEAPVETAAPEPAPVEESTPVEPAAEPTSEPVVAEAQESIPAPPPAAPAAGTLVVQVFSSNNQVQAQAVVDRLRSGGYPALLSPVEVSGRTMYRVRIGPYADRQVAEGIAEQVRRDFRLETWITE